MNGIQWDFTWYVESGLEWSGSEQSLATLFWGKTDPNLFQTEELHDTHTKNYKYSLKTWAKSQLLENGHTGEETCMKVYCSV